MQADGAFLLFSTGLLTIDARGWFFSSRPRAFIRLFVPRDEWPRAIHAFQRDASYQRALRQMALIQFAFAAGFGIIGLCLWLAGRAT